LLEASFERLRRLAKPGPDRISAPSLNLTVDQFVSDFPLQMPSAGSAGKLLARNTAAGIKSFNHAKDSLKTKSSRYTSQTGAGVL